MARPSRLPAGGREMRGGMEWQGPRVAAPPVGPLAGWHRSPHSSHHPTPTHPHPPAWKPQNDAPSAVARAPGGTWSAMREFMAGRATPSPAPRAARAASRAGRARPAATT